MQIDVRELTTYDISDDGKSVVLNLVDAAGEPTSLRFLTPDLGNLSLTLPNLIETALRRQYADTSLRYAFPMGSWSIEEASDPATLIVTLRTKDGFGVSFSMGRANARQLSQSLFEAFAKASAIAITH